jgi:hypothetical protein
MSGWLWHEGMYSRTKIVTPPRCVRARKEERWLALDRRDKKYTPLAQFHILLAPSLSRIRWEKREKEVACKLWTTRRTRGGMLAQRRRTEKRQLACCCVRARKEETVSTRPTRQEIHTISPVLHLLARPNESNTLGKKRKGSRMQVTDDTAHTRQHSSAEETNREEIDGKLIEVTRSG